MARNHPAVSDKDEYNKEIDAMISDAEGLGYDKVEKFDQEQVANWQKAMKQVTEKYAQ